MEIRETEEYFLVMEKEMLANGSYNVKKKDPFHPAKLNDNDSPLQNGLVRNYQRQKQVRKPKQELFRCGCSTLAVASKK